MHHIITHCTPLFCNAPEVLQQLEQVQATDSQDQPSIPSRPKQDSGCHLGGRAPGCRGAALPGVVPTLAGGHPDGKTPEPGGIRARR